jgi:hypothetical protein
MRSVELIAEMPKTSGRCFNMIFIPEENHRGCPFLLTDRGRLHVSNIVGRPVVELGEISDPHGDEYENDCLVGCCVVYSGRN